MKNARVSTAAFLTVLAACMPQTPVDEVSAFTQADDAAIRSVLTQWALNTSEGRFMENLTLHTDDAVELLTPAVEGKEAMRARWEHDLTTKEYGATSVAVREVHGMGNLAYAWAQFMQEGTAAGTAFAAEGNWLVILRRDAEGTWRIHRTIWTAALLDDAQTTS